MLHTPLELSPQDLRDLRLIVELSQDRAPASFESDGLTVRVAQSQAFRSRLAAAAEPLGGLRGPVVLFSADAARSDAFHANLTFVQGHEAFHPNRSNPLAFGVLDGRLGDLSREDSVLGYVVLPPHMDLARPLHIYWNDRRLTTTLR